MLGDDRRGTPTQLQPPVENVESLETFWSPAEKAGVEHALTYAAVGGKDAVSRKIDEFVALTKVDELIVTAQIFDHAARLRTYEIVAGIAAEA